MSNTTHFPPLTIIFLTYQRTDYAVRTLKAIKKNLRYTGEIQMVVMDDGSHEDHVRQVGIAASLVCPIVHIRTKKQGYGAMANEGWQIACDVSPITLWMEDDWVLERPFDVTPYVQLLLEREDVGVVRLGLMPINLNLRSVGHDGRMYLDVKKDEQYAFSGNPHLKHTRAMAWGKYPEGRNPGETEIAYDYQVRSRPGPALWWPLAIGDAPPFGHIGEVQSYLRECMCNDGNTIKRWEIV